MTCNRGFSLTKPCTPFLVSTCPSKPQKKALSFSFFLTHSNLELFEITGHNTTISNFRSFLVNQLPVERFVCYTTLIKACIFIITFISIANEAKQIWSSFCSTFLYLSVCSSLLHTDVVFLSLPKVQTPHAVQRSLAHLLGFSQETTSLVQSSGYSRWEKHLGLDLIMCFREWTAVMDDGSLDKVWI